jgi:phosphoserine phosphatase
VDKKIFLSDFDGTLVGEGVLDAVCEINGIKNASVNLQKANIANGWKSTAPLVNLINSLKGITKTQIKQKLDKNNFLNSGAVELFKFLRENNFVTVLHTGNIAPVAEYYQKLLGIDYIVCPRPQMDGEVIAGITADALVKNFKSIGCEEIIKKLGIKKENIWAIGDSIVDLPVFNLAGHTFAINPKEDIDKHADIVLKSGNLTEVIPYIKARK